MSDALTAATMAAPASATAGPISPRAVLSHAGAWWPSKRFGLGVFLVGVVVTALLMALALAPRAGALPQGTGGLGSTAVPSWQPSTDALSHGTWLRDAHSEVQRASDQSELPAQF